MKTPHLRALLCFAAALSAAPGLAERIDKDYHQRFDVAPGARLQLEHGDGDVTFTPWNQDAVEVDVVYRAEIKGLGASRHGDFEVEFSQVGNRIRITGKEPSFAGIGIFSFDQREYTYKVRAPDYVVLDLKGEDGDVTVDGWRAVIEASLEDGDLHLTDVAAERFDFELEDGDAVIRNLSGELEVKTEDGDVDVQDCTSARAAVHTDDGDVDVLRCQGDFEVRTSDGDVRLGQIRAGAVAIETEDGDVELDLLEAKDLDLTIATDDGKVVVTTAAELSAELDVTTGDGRIVVDLPAADLSENRHRVTGRLGRGEGRIRITTDDGSVTLKKKD